METPSLCYDEDGDAAYTFGDGVISLGYKEFFSRGEWDDANAFEYCVSMGPGANWVYTKVEKIILPKEFL